MRWRSLTFPSSSDCVGESSRLAASTNGELRFGCRYYGTGFIFGKMLCIIICVDYILLAFLDYLYPRDEIDLAPKFDLDKWHQVSSLLSPLIGYRTDCL